MATDSQGQTRKDAMNALYEKYRTSFVEVPEVDARTLHELMSTSKHVVVVDVRDHAEQKVSMIPGSITTGEFERDLSMYKQHEVVCYCTLGYRSGLYAQKMQQQGLDAKNLKGSILAWTHEGYPLVTGEDRRQDTRDVHVFNDQFELQAEGYTPVKFSKGGALVRGVSFIAGSVLPKWLGGSR